MTLRADIQPVVLVGGRSRRFGRDKLREPVAPGADERPVAERRAEPLPASQHQAGERVERLGQRGVDERPAVALAVEQGAQARLDAAGDAAQVRRGGDGRPRRRPQVRVSMGGSPAIVRGRARPATAAGTVHGWPSTP